MTRLCGRGGDQEDGAGLELDGAGHGCTTETDATCRTYHPAPTSSAAGQQTSLAATAANGGPRAPHADGEAGGGGGQTRGADDRDAAAARATEVPPLLIAVAGGRSPRGDRATTPTPPRRTKVADQ